MRVSDADREAARVRLVEAYAAGRVSFEELEARSVAAHGAVTTADLDAAVGDLTVPAASAAPPVSAARGCVRDLLVFLVCGAVSVVIWQVTGRGFFWPLWILVYTGLPLVRLVRRLS